MENLKLFVTNLKRSFHPVNIRKCAWEQFCLNYESEDPRCRIMIRYMVSSLYLRGARRIESVQPGRITFFFPVDKKNPSVTVDRLLHDLQEDLLGFAETTMNILPAGDYKSSEESTDQEWVKTFAGEYRAILNEIHLLGQARN